MRARRFIERMLAAIDHLRIFPNMGRLVPEAGYREDVRELIYQGYRIMYLVRPDQLFMIAIIHGSRNLAGWTDRPWELD